MAHSNIKLSTYSIKTGSREELNKIFNGLNNRQGIEITSTSISFQYTKGGIDQYVMSVSWNYYE